jgi:hypothetical protein
MLSSSFFVTFTAMNPDEGCSVVFGGVRGLSNLSNIAFQTVFDICTQMSSVKSLACLALQNPRSSQLYLITFGVRVLEEVVHLPLLRKV